MKTQLTIITLISILMPISGYANPVQEIMKKFISGGSSSQDAYRGERLECANFHGKWKLKCKMQQNPSEVSITQGSCNSITIGGETTHFGGMTGLSVYTPLEGGNTITQLGVASDWVNKAESFQSKLGGLVKITTSAKSEVIPLSGRVDYALVNNQIRVNMLVHAGDLSFTEECTGEKVN